MYKRYQWDYRIDQKSNIYSKTITCYEMEDMKNRLIIDVYGTKFWYLHDELHRVDGPAEEYADGSKFWRLNDLLHRVDGPAAEWVNGDKFWWLHGKQLFCPVEFKTMEDFFARLNTDEEYSLQYINDINGLIEVINNPTAKQKRLHAMKWKL